MQQSFYVGDVVAGGGTELGHRCRLSGPTEAASYSNCLTC